MPSPEEMSILSFQVECCAYPLHIADPYFPECGPDNLMRIAEQFGILIEHTGMTTHGFAYQVQGPRENLGRFLVAEGFAESADQVEEFLPIA